MAINKLDGRVRDEVRKPKFLLSIPPATVTPEQWEFVERLAEARKVYRTQVLRWAFDALMHLPETEGPPKDYGTMGHRLSRVPVTRSTFEFMAERAKKRHGGFNQVVRDAISALQVQMQTRVE